MSELESNIETVRISVKHAALELQNVTVALRKCYTIANSSVEQYTQLRDSFLGAALVYKGKIFPVASAVVKDIDECFTTFQDLSDADFVELLDDIREAAQKYAERAAYCRSLHKIILVELKKTEDSGEVVVKALKAGEQQSRTKAKMYKSDATNSSVLAVGVTVAGVVLSTFVPVAPVVGAAIFGISGLAAEADEKLGMAALARSEADCAKEASSIITQTLLPALNKFIQCVSAFAGFFQSLEIKLTEVHQKGGQSKLVCRALKTRAKEIKMATESYIQLIPAIETNLECISHSDQHEEHVRTWLKLNKLPHQAANQNLLTLGIELFKDDKKVYRAIQY